VRGEKMRFIFYFIVLASLIPSLQAYIYNERQMGVFIRENQAEIDSIRAKYKVHRGYAVLEVAKQKILSDFESFGHYQNVILSALKGVGVGGLSKTKKANPFERRIGYLALYTIGINTERVTDNFQISELNKPTDAQRRHVDVCNELIRQSNSMRTDFVRLGRNQIPPASRRFAELIDQTRVNLSKQNLQPKVNKIYKAEDFNKEGELDKKYRKLPIKLSLDETITILLKDKEIERVSLVNIIKDFDLMEKVDFYILNKELIDKGVSVRNEWGELPRGPFLTEKDIKKAKAAILAAMYGQEYLKSLLDIKYRDRRIYLRLKPGIRNRMLRLLRPTHPDKLDKAFVYAEGLVKLGNEFSKVLDECKGIVPVFNENGTLLGTIKEEDFEGLDS